MGAGKQEKWNKIILTSLCCLKTATRPLVLLRSQQGSPVRVRFYLGNWYRFLVCRQGVGRKRFFFSFFYFFNLMSIFMATEQGAWSWDVGLRVAVWYHDSGFTGGTKLLLWISLQTCLVFAHLPSCVSCKAVLKRSTQHMWGWLEASRVANVPYLSRFILSNHVSVSGCPNWQPCTCLKSGSRYSPEGYGSPRGLLWVLGGFWQESGQTSWQWRWKL